MNTRDDIERGAALTALKVGVYLAIVFALLAVWLIHWAVGLVLLVILAPVVLWRFGATSATSPYRWIPC